METREIKFRAWDKAKNRMFGSCLSLESFGITEWIQYKTQASNDLIWLQYTGLKDYNGVEIYEGDIIEFDDLLMPGIKPKVKIEFSDGSFWNFNEFYTPDKCIVKGNIHENPELLKK